MKGISMWIVISMVIILVLFLFTVTSMVDIDLLGKSGDILEEAEVRGECDHLPCISGCCDEDLGKDWDTRSCTKNTTHSFRDRCSNEKGGAGLDFVKEYYCSGSMVDYEIHDCVIENGCLEGACKE